MVQLVGCYRAGLDAVFGAANDTPVPIPVEEMLEALDHLRKPLLLAVNDDGIAFHVMTRGEIQNPDAALLFVAWPERVLPEATN